MDKTVDDSKNTRVTDSTLDVQNSQVTYEDQVTSKYSKDRGDGNCLDRVTSDDVVPDNFVEDDNDFSTPEKENDPGVGIRPKGGSVESEESSDPTIVTKVTYGAWESSESKSSESDNVISLGSNSESTCPSENDGVQNGNVSRPESLQFDKPRLHYEKRRSRSDGLAVESYNTAINIPKKQDPEFQNIEETMLSKSMPHGVITKTGDLIEFVAEDLQEKIRRSSPLAKAESSGLSSRASSLHSVSSISSGTSMGTSMASEMSRSPSGQFQQSPLDIPPIDPMAVLELEMYAKRVADNVDLLMGNLKSNLHKMSAITVGCLDSYKKSVDMTCDSVDSSIKSMYALMAKCEELSKSMKPVYQLADQIKEIKRLLDRFETHLNDKMSKTKS